MVRSLLGLEPVDHEVGDDPQVVKQNRRYRIVLITILSVTCLVVVVGVVISTVGVLRLNRVSDVAVEQRDYLVECTTASLPDDKHECFEEGQVRLAEAIEQIVREDARNTKAQTERVLEAIREIFPVAAQE